MEVNNGKVGESLQSVERRWCSLWHVIVEFSVHMLVGTLLFAVIYAPAIALGRVTDNLSSHTSLSPLIPTILRSAEYAIIGSDTLLFLVFTLKTIAVAYRHLFTELRESASG